MMIQLVLEKEQIVEVPMAARTEVVDPAEPCFLPDCADLRNERVEVGGGILSIGPMASP